MSLKITTTTSERFQAVDETVKGFDKKISSQFDEAESVYGSDIVFQGYASKNNIIPDGEHTLEIHEKYLKITYPSFFSEYSDLIIQFVTYEKANLSLDKAIKITQLKHSK